jgi:hypothetical protein
MRAEPPPNLVDPAVVDQPSVAGDHHPRAQMLDVREVVRCQDHGDAPVAIDPLQELPSTKSKPRRAVSTARRGRPIQSVW